MPTVGGGRERKRSGKIHGIGKFAIPIDYDVAGVLRMHKKLTQCAVVMIDAVAVGVGSNRQIGLGLARAVPNKNRSIRTIDRRADMFVVVAIHEIISRAVQFGDRNRRHAKLRPVARSRKAINLKTLGQRTAQLQPGWRIQQDRPKAGNVLQSRRGRSEHAERLRSVAFDGDDAHMIEQHPDRITFKADAPRSRTKNIAHFACIRRYDTTAFIYGQFRRNANFAHQLDRFAALHFFDGSFERLEAKITLANAHERIGRADSRRIKGAADIQSRRPAFEVIVKDAAAIDNHHISSRFGLGNAHGFDIVLNVGFIASIAQPKRLAAIIAALNHKIKIVNQCLLRRRFARMVHPDKLHLKRRSIGGAHRPRKLRPVSKFDSVYQLDGSVVRIERLFQIYPSPALLKIRNRIVRRCPAGDYSFHQRGSGTLVLVFRKFRLVQQPFAHQRNRAGYQRASHGSARVEGVIRIVDAITIINVPCSRGKNACSGRGNVWLDAPVLARSAARIFGGNNRIAVL